MKTDTTYLQHIADAVSDIEQYTAGGREEFFSQKIVQDAVIRNLEVIGEAVKNLSLEFRKNHPAVPWKQIAGLRDILIHHYFGIDLDMVWLVVEKRLPLLADCIQSALAEK